MTRPRPSEHFSWAEFACKDGTPYPEEWEDRAVILAAEAERVRLACGPLVALSVYRTAEWNRRVGGARRSQHVEGRAIDLKVPAGWSIGNFYRIVRAIAQGEESMIFGVGSYPTFVHFDVRPAPATGSLVCWQGSRAWAELKRV